MKNEKFRCPTHKVKLKQRKDRKGWYCPKCAAIATASRR